MFCIDDTKDADSTNKHSTTWLNPNTEEWDKAVEYLEGGGDIDTIKKKYSISKENELRLVQPGKAN